MYDIEEALEALTRQHSVPLGYVLPVEDRPAPSVDGPPLSANIAGALPRIGECVCDVGGLLLTGRRKMVIGKID